MSLNVSVVKCSLYSGTRKPLQPQHLPHSVLPRDSDRARLLRELRELQSAQLTEWSDDDCFKFKLPSSLFEDNSRSIVSVEELTMRADASEFRILFLTKRGCGVA